MMIHQISMQVPAANASASAQTPQPCILLRMQKRTDRHVGSPWGGRLDQKEPMDPMTPYCKLLALSFFVNPNVDGGLGWVGLGCFGVCKVGRGLEYPSEQVADWNPGKMKEGARSGLSGEPPGALARRFVGLTRRINTVEGGPFYLQIRVYVYT